LQRICVEIVDVLGYSVAFPLIWAVLVASSVNICKTACFSPLTKIVNILAKAREISNPTGV